MHGTLHTDYINSSAHTHTNPAPANHIYQTAERLYSGLYLSHFKSTSHIFFCSFHPEHNGIVVCMKQNERFGSVMWCRSPMYENAFFSPLAVYWFSSRFPHLILFSCFHRNNSLANFSSTCGMRCCFFSCFSDIFLLLSPSLPPSLSPLICSLEEIFFSFTPILPHFGCISIHTKPQSIT